jgi:hypothetical protein
MLTYDNVFLLTNSNVAPWIAILLIKTKSGTIYP